MSGFSIAERFYSMNLTIRLRRPWPTHGWWRGCRRSACGALLVVRCGLPSMVVGLITGCAAMSLDRPSRDMALDLPVEERWAAAGQANGGDAATGWLKMFRDPEMEKLVDEAIHRNQNLRATAAQLKAARQGTIIGRAALLPSVDARLNGLYSKTSATDETGSRGPFVLVEDFRLSLNASWEPDLWGRLADGYHATVAGYRAELADFQGARLSLAANTAKAWCNLITARQQVELAEQTRESFAANLRIVERNYMGGDLTQSPLDVHFARTQLASAERGVLSQKLARDEARRSLELLAGRYPAARIKGRDALPTLKKNVPAGLPSELLMRRPDLFAAASRVIASADRADAARKEMLPSITLTGGVSSGSATSDLIGLLADPSTIAYNVGAALAQPVYRGGALKAQGEQALALNEAAVQAFSDAALRAFREVESALATDSSLGGQFGFLQKEVKSAGLAEVQAERDLFQGDVGYLSILEAQRRAFNARSAMINLRNQRLQNRIDLHLALGGDFLTPPAPPVEISSIND